MCAITLVWVGGMLGQSPLTNALGAAQGCNPQSFSAPLKRGFEQASAAAELAQSARSAQEWDRVAQAWLAAIATLQTISPEQPERTFIQGKLQEYLYNLTVAQQQASSKSDPDIFPSLGSQVLDRQIRLYLSYVATVGPPDILIVGSSRALQGIEPQILQQSLRAEGEAVRVFNLSVNGATAQVVNFMMQRLLSPEQLPRLVIWGDGSRAFNGSRVDATFTRILNSPGYQVALAGEKPVLDPKENQTTERQPSQINAYGFLPIANAFDPELYYQTRPRVSGRYDAFYNPFSLTGLQDGALRSLVSYLNDLNIRLVYVHLPLSQDYLDEYRLSLDRQFQQFLQTQSRTQGFAVIDLLTQWLGRDDYFADPSHLNRAGAAALSAQLARQPVVLDALRTDGAE